MNLRDRLREQGYRLTPQRELVLAAVEKLQHATPDEVYAEVQASSSAVNRSTVYRTLEVLEELGLVRHLHLSDRAPTYHAVEAHPHFHLKCRKCGAAISVAQEKAAGFVERLREDEGFDVDVAHLTVFGAHVECPASDSESEEEPHAHD